MHFASGLSLLDAELVQTVLVTFLDKYFTLNALNNAYSPISPDEDGTCLISNTKKRLKQLKMQRLFKFHEIRMNIFKDYN